MAITTAQFTKLFPRADARFVGPITETFARFSINTRFRKAAFLAQAGHESMGFTVFRENLNYSAEGLLDTFPKYFKSLSQARAYARQPEKIANFVYANRMGNGPVASGDGWLFRGRGAIQLTGRYMYVNFAEDDNMKLNQAIDYIETPIGAVMSAGWFWRSNNLNALADQQQFKTLTKRINAGMMGYEDRLRIYEAALKVV